MVEFVNVELKHNIDDEKLDKIMREHYPDLVTFIEDEIGVGVESSEAINIFRLSLEGPEESLRKALNYLFVNSSSYHPVVEVDKPSYVCDLLSRIHPFFRSSSKKGYEVALELLKEKRAKIKTGVYTGVLGMSSAKF